jgi:hypothetical protein
MRHPALLRRNCGKPWQVAAERPILDVATARGDRKRRPPDITLGEISFMLARLSAKERFFAISRL